MSENVQVAVRVRPFNEREKSMESTSCIRMVKETQQTIITDPETNIEKAFTFDYSYNSFAPPSDPAHASQQTVWEDIGIKVLEHAWNGFNVSLFAYGQTGYGSDKGIIPKASAVIFERIEANPSEITFKVEASMMEIYNERVKDLFNPSSDNLKVRDHPSQGPYAEGLTRSAVSSYSEIDRSELNLSTGKVMDKVSRINLIDLAGSERAASTGATGSRLKEGAAINQTHLLKDSLGGNSKTIMIAALSPASVNYSETLGTLRYADRAKQIKNKAIVNEDPNQILIRQLKEELELLRKSMMENMDARPPSRGVGGGGEGELGAEFNGSRSPRINTARERELAAIREQLEENQRLLQESEKTRRAAQVLGLVSNASELKEKTMTNPHLLNLNEDQQMSEKLVYFINPGSNRIGRIDADEEQNIVIEELAHESRFDWQCAMKELNSKQIKATMEAEVIAEKEKQEMDARMKKMEEMMQAEQKLAEEKLGRQREEWEQHVRALNEQMKVKELEIKTHMQMEGDNDKKKLAEQLAQQESKLAEELVKAEILFEKKQQELVERQKELEVSLQKQMREAKVLGSQKERERVERMKFDDLLLQSIPLVNEANSIADELQKQTLFTLRLITSGPTLVALTGKCETLEDEELAISNRIGAELKVEVNFQESGTFRSVMWDIEQFHANVYVMREMYQTFIEHNRLPAYVETWKGTYGDDCDPFYDPPKPQLIGKSFVFLRNLVFGCKINETTSIFNHTGGNSGCLKLELEYSGARRTRGTQVGANISPSVDPQLDFNVVIEQVVTLELVEFLQNSPLEFRVYGIVPSSNLNKVASHAVDLKNTKSSVDLYVGDGSVQFYNADANGRNTLLNNKKSMRRRKGKAMDDENSDILQQYREQLTVQEKTLAENTLELEHKTQEVITLQQYLEFERTQNTDLRCALESLERTNKLLKAKLEEQILKGTIAVPVPAIPEPIQTTNLPTITTTSSDDPAPIVKSSRERPKTASRRRSRAEMDREGVEGTPVDDDPVLTKSFEKKESLAETLSSKEYRAQALNVDLVGGQRSVRVDGSLATATMSGLTTYPAMAGVSEHSEGPIVPKRIEKPRKSECIVM
ncbi:Kinesin-like protein [Phytophthora cactorum]|nr:Kinesin-like protein [Phytophthora cactorum]